MMDVCGVRRFGERSSVCGLGKRTCSLLCIHERLRLLSGGIHLPSTRTRSCLHTRTMVLRSEAKSVNDPNAGKSYLRQIAVTGVGGFAPRDRERDAEGGLENEVRLRGQDLPFLTTWSASIEVLEVGDVRPKNSQWASQNCRVTVRGLLHCACRSTEGPEFVPCMCNDRPTTQSSA